MGSFTLVDEGPLLATYLLVEPDAPLRVIEADRAARERIGRALLPATLLAHGQVVEVEPAAVTRLELRPGRLVLAWEEQELSLPTPDADQARALFEALAPRLPQLERVEVTLHPRERLARAALVVLLASGLALALIALRLDPHASSSRSPVGRHALTKAALLALAGLLGPVGSALLAASLFVAGAAYAVWIFRHPPSYPRLVPPEGPEEPSQTTAALREARERFRK
ncbi:MAG: hypothetical protein AB7N76_23130 [Planctomycetota bacterium]